jgi:hypothetical protein
MKKILRKKVGCVLLAGSFLVVVRFLHFRNGVEVRDRGGNLNPSRRCKLCGHYGGALYEVLGEKSWVHVACVLPFDEV